MQLNICHTLHSWHEILTHSPTYWIFPPDSSQFAGCFLLQSMTITIYFGLSPNHAIMFYIVCHLILHANVLSRNHASICFITKSCKHKFYNRLGTRREIADATVFLASGVSALITAQYPGCRWWELDGRISSRGRNEISQQIVIENQWKVTRSSSYTTEACDLKATVVDGLLNINAGPLQLALQLLIHVSPKYSALVRDTCLAKEKE